MVRVRHSAPSPGRRAVVLLPGIGMSHRYNRRLFNALSTVADAYSLDLPGFGTPAPAERMSVPDFAASVADALDARGVADAVVVGHSMGAQFAVALAVRRPDLVSHTVLVGPVAAPARRTAVEQGIALVRDSLREPPSVVFTTVTDYFRCGPRWYLTELPVMLEYPIEDEIARLGSPVLVLRGENDPIADPDWCTRLVSRARVAELEQVPRRRHVVQQSAPTEVAARILRFAEHHTRV
ncbi:alpha/beta hydrolase [Okibacterium endophyticum]